MYGIRMVLVWIFISSCGAGPKSQQGAPVTPPRSGDGYAFDTAALLEMNRVYTQQGAKTTWDLHLMINGETAIESEQESAQQTAQRLQAISLRRDDNVHITLVIRDGERVLATNDPSVAAEDGEFEAFWKSSCSTIRQDLDLVEVENGAERQWMMQMSICDFAGFSLKASLEIKPQQKVLEKKTVIYDCSFDPHRFSDGTTKEIGAYIGEFPCTYGYETLPGEETPKIEILADYAEGTPLFNEKLLRMDDVYLKIGNAGQFVLEMDFNTPPFGSIQACPVTKVDVKFAKDGELVSQRLEFKRNNSAGQIWMPQDSDSWPSLSEVIAYYKGSVSEKINIYMICEWIPETKDLSAGKVLTLSN